MLMPKRDIMIRAIAGFALLLTSLASAGQTEDFAMPAWATAHVSSAMCQGSQMHLVVTGNVAVAYERAYAVLTVSNVLENVGASYIRTLPAGAKTNMVIIPTATNREYTVIWQNDRGDVRDVWHRTDTNTFFEYGYVITGERFFGAFETIMDVHVLRTGNGQTAFRADLLVYPHNGIVRFIFSNLISVERYFRDTTDRMSAEVARVCGDLCQSNDVAAAVQKPTSGF
jgi:hypothetical protein